MKFNTSAQKQDRGLFHLGNVFILNVILLCTLLCLASCGPCSISGMQKSVDYDGCGSYSNYHNAGFQDMFVGDVSSGYVPTNSLTHLSLENICRNSDLFCFPSTLHDFSSEEHMHDLEAAMLEVSATQSNESLPVRSPHQWRWAGNSNSSWSSDYGMFKLVNGRSISCSLTSRDDMHDRSSLETSSSIKSDLSSCRGPLVNKKEISFLTMNSEKIGSGYSEEISSVHVEINPPLIDWGQKYLYFPSLAFLTVANTKNDSILHVYEPFSTDIQFYSCNLSEVVLGPGEVASICFVFLPRWLGLSSAHLILQTSSGGFVVRAKGFAIDSPYGIRPIMGMEASSSGQWSKNLSLFNPFDEILYVKEVTSWVSISLGSSLHTAEATCTVENNRGYDEHIAGRDRLDVRSGRIGFPVMTMMPHRNWEIGSRSTETLIEMDFSFDYKGNVVGVFCIQLVRSSQDKSDIVMIPLEAEVDGKAIYDHLISSVSVSLEALVPCDALETIGVAISLRNDASNIVSVVKISEITDTELFQIKYMEGLILFPGSVTQVAVASFTPLPKAAVNMNCKLLVLTNESSSPQIEIPCQDIISICSRHQLDSSVGYKYQLDTDESSNTRTGSLGSGMQLPSRIKALETAEADELVLKNWKLQGIPSAMSVLDDHEVLFPMVHVGAHLSKWINVKNPSQLPVVMQMILNSGQIIDECRGPDEFLHHPSSSNLVHTEATSPSRYGFSIAENALTEAYVHPHGRASFGPIFFHPSSRCGWRSSALIRNNLSGVEWISLQGFGGLLSLVLLEDSEPVESLEFNFKLPIGLNISPADMLIQMEDAKACSQPLSKEVFAKNTGDLPLDVRRIEVSGTECRLDGFLVHSCKSFSLKPGESAKLLISYQTDFSGPIVHRDLELALATGILVIPMKASLPLCMLNFCKRSIFWMRVRKSSVAILLAASLMFLVFGCILPHVVAWGSHDLFQGEKSSIATVRTAGKSSRAHRNQRYDKFPAYTKMDGLLRSVGKEESSLLGSLDNADGHGVTSNLGISSQHANFVRANQEKNNNFIDAHKEKTLPSSLLSKSVAVENSDLLEASQSGNLTVRIGKDKGRRRRKRKGAGAGPTALFDVSSSQSGNSTPSSPLSPVTSLAPSRTCMFSTVVSQPIKARNLFTQVAHQHCEKRQVFGVASKANILECKVSMKDCNNNWLFSTQEQPPAPRKTASGPVLLPSATFPSTGRHAPSVMCPSNFLAPSPSIAPHARAPGSNLYNQRMVLRKEKAACGDEFTYDIWGDHFSGLHLMGSRSKEIPAVMSMETESSSDSFFVRGPQTLMEKSQLISDYK